MSGVLEFLLPRCALSAIVAVLAILGEGICRRRMPEAMAGGVWGTVLLLPFLPSLPLVSDRGWLDVGHRALQAAITPDGIPLRGGVEWGITFGAASAVLYALFAHAMARPARRSASESEKSDEAPSSLVLSAFHWALAQTKASRAPRIKMTASEGPAVVGWLRPVIRLPSALATGWTEEQLRRVFLHECAHIVRHDVLRGLAVDLAAALLWFHPAARIARRRLADLRELATDRCALRVAGDVTARDYRRTLLQLARPMAASSPSAAFGEAGILQRLRALENQAAGRLRHSGWLRTAVALALLLACTPIAQPSWSSIVAEQRDVPGCLSLRYAVLGALAEAEASSVPDPRDDSR
jgi:hypothetical protein